MVSEPQNRGVEENSLHQMQRGEIPPSQEPPIISRVTCMLCPDWEKYVTGHNPAEILEQSHTVLFAHDFANHPGNSFRGE